jgi:hypothetical protein
MQHRQLYWTVQQKYEFCEAVDENPDPAIQFDVSLGRDANKIVEIMRSLKMDSSNMNCVHLEFLQSSQKLAIS